MIIQRRSAHFKVTARGRGSCKTARKPPEGLQPKIDASRSVSDGSRAADQRIRQPTPNPQGSLGKQHSSLIDSMASLVKESAVRYIRTISCR